MEAKSVLYAAVGAPVVAARKVGQKADEYKGKLTSQASGYGKTLEKTVDGWATEGEKVIGKIGDQKVVEDIASRVDLDQAKDQVSKLRDQLEEMLATWRSSFRPEGTATETSPAKEPAAKSTTAKKPAAKSTTAKKPAAKSTTAKTATAKASSTKKTS